MTTGVPDRFAAARAVADAVLYEGYVLYPYRASSRKNQLRWQFGVLAPRVYCEADASERSSMRTECLVDPGGDLELTVRVRCLQVQHRGIEAVVERADALDGLRFEPVESLRTDQQTCVAWDEAVEQVVDLPPVRSGASGGVCHEEAVTFGASAETEAVHWSDGALAGRIVRSRQAVDGRVHVEVAPCTASNCLLKVVVTVENTTELAEVPRRRDEVMGSSLVAVHAMLAVDGGAFVSLIDPPPEASAAALECRNEGTFPVLVSGDDVVLSSPIILYDHPQVAPESPGDLYDSTEIDEILALRILTLTEDERSEARATDARAAAIVDRCDEMPPEIWDRLHGAMRSLAGSVEPEWAFEALLPTGPEESEAVPWWDPAVDSSVDPWSDSVVVAGVEISKGSAVRLRPSHRSDAQDLFLEGLSATVAGVFKDVDGNEQVAVTVDDDPATDELPWQGRYLFFHPDELVPLDPDAIVPLDPDAIVPLDPDAIVPLDPDAIVPLDERAGR